MIRKMYARLAGPLLRDLEKIKLDIAISTSLARASATAPLREISSTSPLTWEFSGFSQNGEDGIIDFLIGKLTSIDKYFIEIGASNGLENNTAWLSHAKKFKGLMIEGDPDLVRQGNLVKQFLVYLNQLFVDTNTTKDIADMALMKTPDLLSLDIDGNDYYIAKSLFEKGFRPKIMLVEYNSAYGPERCCTIQYDPRFNAYQKTDHHLYYGVSLAGWKKFFASYGYRFITVESNGVNAFFADPKWFEDGFLNNISSTGFTENAHQYRKFKTGWQEQFNFLKNCELVEI